MVVFFPPSTYTRRRSGDPDDDETGGARHYYVRLEPVSSSDDDEEEEDDDADQRRPTARGRRRRRRNRHARLILELPDEEEEYYTDEEDESDKWDPCLHLDELPQRPMSRLHKACIDVLFVVATAAMEGVFVWTTLHPQQQHGGGDKVSINWLIAVPLMLPVMAVILFLAALVYFLVTSDFSWRPPPAPADEKV